MEVACNGQTRNDIITFYNKEYIERMKHYMVCSRSATMEQGARTPVLNKSSFAALLTPGGRTPSQRLIGDLIPMTPLIDQVGGNQGGLLQPRVAYTPLVHNVQ